jgi:hypothetical protein
MPVNNLRDSMEARIQQARLNLGAGSLVSVLGSLLQNTGHAIPTQDDSYLNSKIRTVPQYIKDQTNYGIDQSLRASTEGVLNNAPLNRASNTLAAMENNATNAKSNAAVQYGKEDIGLTNRFLDQKNASQQAHNAALAQQQNEIINNTNTQIGNVAAIGTNYFNELQKAQNRVNAFQDQKALNAESMNYMQNFIQAMKGKNPVTGEDVTIPKPQNDSQWSKNPDGSNVFPKVPIVPQINLDPSLIPEGQQLDFLNKKFYGKRRGLKPIYPATTTVQ